MRARSNRNNLRWVAVFSLLVCGAVSGLEAQSSSPDDSPKNAMEIYFWGAGIHGQLLNGLGGETFEVSFEDIMDSLKMAGMAAYRRDLGRWSVSLDLIYLDVGGSREDSVTLPVGEGLTATVDGNLDVKSWIGGLYGGYGLSESAASNHEVIFGVRYFSMSTDLRIDIDDPLPPTLPGRDFSTSSKLWDGVVGIQGHQGLGGAWSLPYHVDIGTGDSKITYQGMVGVAYGFRWGEVSATYRYLYYDQGEGEPIQDMYLDGPAMGVRFEF